MSRMPIRALGLAWYKREDYPRILQIIEDADKLPPTHEKWLYSVQKVESQAKRKGTIVVRAVIDPDEFIAYYARHDLKVDAQARMRFSSDRAAEQIKTTHRGVQSGAHVRRPPARPGRYAMSSEAGVPPR